MRLCLVATRRCLWAAWLVVAGVCAHYSSTCSAFDNCPLSRYDGLVGMFDPKGRSVPCVGVSESEVCSMKSESK